MSDSTPDSVSATFYTEGKAKFQVGNAFYRSASQVVRDLGVLAAAIYKSDRGILRVIDAMTGCGVRTLRYWLESGADWIWANDSNPEIRPVLENNLKDAIASGQCQITHTDANRIFFDCYNRRDYYDLVDVDCFGSAAPYLHTALWATKIGGLLYLTSTDGRTATGHQPENSLSIYGAYTRCHPASQEQVLRLLIGSAQQAAASIKLGIEPIFSLFTGQTYRVMLRLLAKPCLTPENYGFLGYCHQCGDYQVVSWRKLGKTCCQRDGSLLILSGPMWLGQLHHREQLRRMQSLAQRLEWSKRLELLATMEAETDFPPYFYTLTEIGRRGKLDLPKRSHLIQALQERGYRATITHINAQAIKTNADLMACISIARTL
ncbi:tRNA (guanine-N1)-methyltransferase [Hydrococcus rivularis NIES-593]|uniref:tRNA (Guanine-N1)-methyltransferase n=1 Tax=Hydrococcus rivularis NIES-593 TaxID=1921803 RepID=A0A1U7HQY5_9CYAN|nr:tRNA (guanine-N1)-methyltransferase [Hydrococcus rivularis]OKH25958.1 tRNA (guanine-N1)-methyltransferase [Hydrococcus rivularis NIES-593]